MKLVALSIVAGTCAFASHAQLQVRQFSEVSVGFYEMPGAFPTTISDTINETSGFESVFRQHSVTYDDPSLADNPLASSQYSVSTTVLGKVGNFYKVQVDISGQVYRRGPLPGGSFGMFNAADAISTLEVEFDIALIDATWNASYASTSPQLVFSTLPYAASVSVHDPLTTPHLMLPVDGQSNTASGHVNGSGQIARINAIADLTNILVQHVGETTVNYNVSLLGIVSDIPTPGTATLPLIAGLLVARRRR